MSMADWPTVSAAYRVYRKALRDGALTPQPCEVCGEKRVHGHHEDYSKPLDVMWLCSTHHGERHRWLNRQRRSLSLIPVEASAA